jgi:hypothetical protein
MHPNTNAVAGDRNELLLERMPNGELCWLRPDRPLEKPAGLSPLQRFAQRFAAATRRSPRYVLTDEGRRALAMSRLFDEGPTVAEVSGAAKTFSCACSASGDGGRCPYNATSARQLQDHYQDVHYWAVSLCPACAWPQKSPSCARREHWGVS